MHNAQGVGKSLGNLGERVSQSQKLGIDVGPIDAKRIGDIIGLTSQNLMEAIQIVCEDAGLSQFRQTSSEVDLLDQLKNHINNSFEKHHETLDEKTLLAVKNLYILLKASRKMDLKTAATTAFVRTERVSYNNGEYGPENRKSTKSTIQKQSETAFTSYLKDAIKWHEKNAGHHQTESVSTQHQYHYILKLAVKLRLGINLADDQVTSALNKAHINLLSDIENKTISDIVDQIKIRNLPEPPHKVGPHSVPSSSSALPEMLQPNTELTPDILQSLDNTIQKNPETLNTLLQDQQVIYSLKQSFKLQPIVTTRVINQLYLSKKIEMLPLLNILKNEYDEINQGTLLHWAASQCNSELIRGLIESGADINAKDRGGNTAYNIFFEIFNQWSSKNFNEIAQLLNPSSGTDDLGLTSHESIESFVNVLYEFHLEVAQQATTVHDLFVEIEVPTIKGDAIKLETINCSIKIARGENDCCIVGVSPIKQFLKLVLNYKNNKDIIHTILTSIGVEDPSAFMDFLNQSYYSCTDLQGNPELQLESAFQAIAGKKGLTFKGDAIPDNLYYNNSQGKRVMETVGDGNCGFNAIALGLLDNLTADQIQCCIDKTLLKVDQHVLDKTENTLFKPIPNPITGHWLKTQFEQILIDFEMPNTEHGQRRVSKQNIIQRHRWLQQILAGHLRLLSVNAVDQRWSDVSDGLKQQVIELVNAVSSGEFRGGHGDICKYFGDGMLDLHDLSYLSDEVRRREKVEEWFNSKGKEHYLKTLATVGFNTDDLPHKVLLEFIEKQLLNKPSESSKELPFNIKLAHSGGHWSYLCG